ncbi:hypothetical protein F443_02917 [Phytophthora nicotianae P1569]|uniref:Uncharacterized protein n=2 Tax=Phytophthora nicotianae TaxID=4792 RepID=V9FRW5_PHYNI|nr:hypothetical protein F443_02917 [Phytophthora nicotianae P1569]ETO82992.1 hypothetical protein F444_02925 [Phytophthora nicotianae P1976]
MRIDTACTQAVVHAIMDDPELYQSGILDSWCSVVSPFSKVFSYMNNLFRQNFL